MHSFHVTTDEELDTALRTAREAGRHTVSITSDNILRIDIWDDTGLVVEVARANVEAHAGSNVVAGENSCVRAYRNSYVSAMRGSLVDAYSGSHVKAFRNSRVVALDPDAVITRFALSATIIGGRLVDAKVHG